MFAKKNYGSKTGAIVITPSIFQKIKSSSDIIVDNEKLYFDKILRKV